MSYEPTANEDIVLDISSREIDLAVIIQRYQDLKVRLQTLPVLKIAPDAETLEIYNRYVDDSLRDTNSSIFELYAKVKPIKDAGLLPSKYDDEYQLLENYVNSL